MLSKEEVKFGLTMAFIILTFCCCCLAGAAIGYWGG